MRVVVYAGPVTRTVVELDQGGEVVVVRQNTTGASAPEEAGQAVTVAWSPDSTFAIEDRRKENE